MALNPALIAVALLLLMAVTTTPPVQAVELLKTVNILGRVCCTPTGTCPIGAKGIPGLLVNLSCTNLVNATVTIGNSITDLKGNFNISVPNIANTIGSVTSVFGGSLPCNVTAKLPISQTVCPVLSTTNGILFAIPTLVNTLLSSVLGLVGNFLASLCVIISGPITIG